MYAITEKGLLVTVLFGALGCGPLCAVGSLTGTYTLSGNKGVITLVLSQEADGNVTGSLNGGDLALVLKGMLQSSGVVVGATATVQGQFASYFQTSRVGDQLAFDLIGSNAKNEPDLTQMTRITFPVAGAGATMSPAGIGPAGGGGAVANASPAATGRYAGTFTGDGLTLESRATATGYAGLIKLGEQSFPFSARMNGENLAGVFESADGKFDFTAVLNGAALQLQTSGAIYNLSMQGPRTAEKPPPANPLAKAGRSAGATPAVAAAAGPTAGETRTRPQGGPGQGADWKVYKHPTGLSMRHPPDWTLTQLPTALQLMPPNVAMNAAGAAEAYFVLAEAAQGITSPEDPRVVQYFGQEMAKFAPFLRQSGPMERIRAGSAPGIVLLWEGTSPAGIGVRAEMFITILKGYGLAILALGDRAKLAQREDAVRGMFSSFAAGVGEKDPRLVGAWKFWSYSSSADGRFGTTTDRRFVLQADGSCFWSGSSESSGNFSGRNSLGETTWTGGVAGQNNSGVKRGQWSAGNGSLHVLWDDGSGSMWDYEVGGVPGNRRLNLKGNGAKPDEWVEGK